MQWRNRDKEGGLEPSAGRESSWGVKVATREVPCLQGPISLSSLFIPVVGLQELSASAAQGGRQSLGSSRRTRR